MMPLRSDRWPEAAPEQAHSQEAVGFINHLRFIAMTCRSKPRADLFEACALLHVNRSHSQEAHAEALMRCLAEALGKSARLLAPGEAELTFDETWLMQLGEAYARSDDLSINFLLRSRVKVEHQRLVKFLMGRISEYFALN
ncbi:MAG: hypothetical protein AAF755_02250 [Pseudomonadota bacterium]